MGTGSIAGNGFKVRALEDDLPVHQHPDEDRLPLPCPDSVTARLPVCEWLQPFANRDSRALIQRALTTPMRLRLPAR